MIIKFDLNYMFFEVNPHLKSVGYFGEVFKKDKTKIKKRCNYKCWAAVFLYSKFSPYKNLTEEDRKRAVERDIFKKKGVLKIHEDLYKFKETIDKIEKTAADRLFEQWCRLADKRKDYIDTLSLDYAKNVDKIDKLISQNSKLFDELERIEKQLKKEDIVKERTKGNSKESLNEKGDLDIE